MEHKDVFLLEMIIDFCNRVAGSLEKHELNYELFIQDLELQDMFAFRVEQIGEYVNDLSDRFKSGHPEIEWHKIVGFRNIVAHAYGSVDMDDLWAIITQDLPVLCNFCRKQISK